MKHEIIADTGRFNIARYRNYDYFHHWTGHSVAVLPIIHHGAEILNGSHKALGDALLYPRENFYGFRLEDLPCWQASKPGPDLPGLTCVTGGMDEKEAEALLSPPEGAGESLVEVLSRIALRELREEMGLVPVEYSCFSDGPMFTSKGSNLQVSYFIMTVKVARFVDPEPDSEFEEHSTNLWVPKEKALELYHSMDLHSRMLMHLAGIKRL